MKPLLILASVVVGQAEPRQAEPRVEIDFVQSAPEPGDDGRLQRSPRQECAVVLIHGLRLHPFSNSNVNKAEMSSWQRPKSSLVNALAKEADVFALAYSQNAPFETIAAQPELIRQLGRLKEMGYRDIALVGHSIGGVLARNLVEDHPRLGVTKVIQVASPNAGSSWAKATWGVRRNQEAFLESITHEGREKALAARAAKKIPRDVAFVCVVCRIPITAEASIEVGKLDVDIALKRGDGVVSCARQWSPDVQAQGIPATVLNHPHFTAMFGRSTAETLVQLLREPPGRWNADQVDGARKQILGALRMAP